MYLWALLRDLDHRPWNCVMQLGPNDQAITCGRGSVSCNRVQLIRPLLVALEVCHATGHYKHRPQTEFDFNLCAGFIFNSS